MRIGSKVLSVLLSISMVFVGPWWRGVVYACPPPCSGSGGGGPCEGSCAPQQESAGAPEGSAAEYRGENGVAEDGDPCTDVSDSGCASVGIPNAVRYAPGDARKMAGLPEKYASMDGSYATKNDTNDELFIRLDAGFVKFKKVNGVWQHVLENNVRGPAAYTLTLAQGDTTFSQDFTVEEQRSGLTRKFVFKAFDGFGADDGKLWKIEQAGGTIEYTRDGQGRVSSATDAYGRTTHYYYTGAGYIEYQVRCSAGSITDNKGPVKKYVYDGVRITEMWEGTPNVAQPTYSNASHYDWKKTLYWHDANGRLKYVVGPAYKGTLTQSSSEDDVKVMAHLAYAYDANGKVSQVIGGSCSSCAGSTSAGVKYSYPESLDDLCPGANPTGRNAPTKQMDLQHLTQATLGGDVTWHTDEKVQTSETGQLIIRYKVLDDVAGAADPVRIEKYLYSTAEDDSAGRLEYIYTYEGVANDIEAATLKRVVKYEFDANGFVQYEKVSSDGQSWTTKKRYDRTSTGRVTKSYVYKDNNTSYVTDYTYDASGRMTKKEEPEVTQNLAKAGGASYRPTTEYSFTSEGDMDTVTDPSGIITKYFYAYNDDINQDGDGQTDEADGSEGFMRTKVVVDYGEGRLNLTTTYTYTKQNNQWRLTGMTDARGKTWSYSVDAWGRRTRVTSPEGYMTDTTYDLNDRITEVKKWKLWGDLGGTEFQTAMTYDVYGNVLMEKEYVDATHYFATCYRHDNAGRLRKTWTRVYDASYDGSSDPTGTVHGNLTEYKYQHTGRLIAEVWQGARDTTPVKVVSNTYDVFGSRTKARIYRASDNDYNDTDYTYDFQGRLTAVDGPGDAYAAYTYDERDLATEVKQYDGSAQGTFLAYAKTYYDEARRTYRSEVVNPDHTNFARTTDYYRDKAGRLCRVEDPGDDQTDYDYDGAGRMNKVTDAEGNVVEYTLDAAGSRTRVKTRHKLTAAPTYRDEWALSWYDDDGRVDTIANYGTNDPGANPEKPASSDSTKLVTKYAYSWSPGAGVFTAVTDPEGTVTHTYVDLLGRTTKVREDYGTGKIDRTTLYAYDLEDTDFYDRILAENGAETNQETRYWRTDGVDASRVTKVTYPDDGYVTYAFRRDGVPNTRVDQRSWTTTYTCDAAGRVTAEAVTGQDVTGTKNVRTTYDALGRVTQVEDDCGKLDGQNPDYDYSKVTYAYAWDDDSAEMTVTETHYFAGSSIGAVTSIIDAEGQRTKLTYPNGRYVTYTYDGNGRVDQITDDDSAVLVDYDYKGLYLQDRKLNGDALRLTFKDQNDLDGYDAFGRIDWMRHYDVSGPTDVVKLSYGYDYVGSPKYEEDLVNADMDQLYGYDALHRLTSFGRGNLNQNKDALTDNPIPREQSWTLQHVGNWDDVTSKTGGADDHPYDDRTHNTVNEITAIDPQGQVAEFTVVSDDAGNLKVLPDRTDLTQAERYTYDYRNRLVKAEHTNNYNDNPPTWATVVEYYYDGFNRRVKKDLASGTDVLYLYDGWQVIEEQELDGEVWEARRQYVFGDRYLDEELLFDKDTDSDGECTDAGGSTRRMYCHNNNYNVVALTDSAGAVVERVKYDPYGQPTCIRTSDSHEQTASHFDNPYLFQGQRFDPETGLYYFKNRYYRPDIGRFLQRDPSGYADGMNLYELAGADPMSHVDPYGMSWLSDAWGWLQDLVSLGWSFEFGAVRSAGGVVVYCCDPNGCEWMAFYRKDCWGIYLALSVQVDFVQGLDGAKCPAGLDLQLKGLLKYTESIEVSGGLGAYFGGGGAYGGWGTGTTSVGIGAGGGIRGCNYTFKSAYPNGTCRPPGTRL